MADLDDIVSFMDGEEYPAPPATEAVTPAPRRPRGRPRKETSSTPVPNTARAKAAAPKIETPMPKSGEIAAAMTKTYGYMAWGMMPLGKPQTAAVIMENAEACGLAWEELAKTNPAVRRALIGMMSGGAVAGLIMAHVPILMAAMAERSPKEPRGSEISDGPQESAPDPTRIFSAPRPNA